jgi:uncharacterized SAM-binding protein YcdF (DUF218 family)
MRRRLVRLAVPLLLLFAIAAFAFARAGVWLAVADPLQHAKAVVVLGGAMPYRAIEAADVYKAGWADEVWVTHPRPTEEEIAASKVGVTKIAEHEYSVRVLDKLGVPSAQVKLLDRGVVNTADEMRSVAALLRPEDRVILITSKYHARRVRTLWHSFNGNHPQAIVRYTASDPFNAERWWRNSRDGLMVMHEWFGLANAWLGFPVSSVRTE